MLRLRSGLLASTAIIFGACANTPPNSPPPTTETAAPAASAAAASAPLTREDTIRKMEEAGFRREVTPGGCELTVHPDGRTGPILGCQ